MKFIRNEDLAKSLLAALGDYGPLVAVDEYGRLLVNLSTSSLPQSSSASVSQVTATGTSGSLASANANRKALSIFNSSGSQTAYIAIGEAASSTKVPIRAGEWWHMADLGIIFTQEVFCIDSSRS